MWIFSKKKDNFRNINLEMTRGLILILLAIIPIGMALYWIIVQHDKEFRAKEIDYDILKFNDEIDELKMKIDLARNNKIIFKGDDIIYPGFNTTDMFSDIVKRNNNWLYNDNLNTITQRNDVVIGELIFTIENKKIEKIRLENQRLDLFVKDEHLINYYVLPTISALIIFIMLLLNYSGYLMRLK